MPDQAVVEGRDATEGHDPTCPYLRYRLHRECVCGESLRTYRAWRDSLTPPARNTTGGD